MASEKAPAFQFYPKDFLSDGKVAAMTMAQRGVYITLLSHCWLEGSLPDDPRRLARMVGLSGSEFAKVWPSLMSCFTAKGDALVHKRLDMERKKQDDYRALQRAKGLASAASRLQPEGNRGSTDDQPESNSSISCLPSSSEENIKAAAPPRSVLVENPAANVKVVTRLAHEIIQDADKTTAFPDLKDLLKAACSQHRIAYDAEVAGKALESALAQRRLH